IVLKATAKEPAGRYASAADLEEDLRRFLADRPIQARRASAWERTRRWCRRNPGWAATAATVLGLLVVIAVGGTLLAVLATRAKQEALDAAADEKKAKETAQAREAETRAILEFVEGKIFAAARPEGLDGGLGRDVTLRQAVEAALPFVETSFT